WCNTPYLKAYQISDFQKLQVQPTVATHRLWSDPQLVLWVCGSPLQPLPKPSLENLAKSRSTNRPMVRRPDYGSWSMSVDRGPLYPASDMNDGQLVWTIV
ncbi:hypothetical protein MTR67_044665, partial [Solanum verrucosum]